MSRNKKYLEWIRTLPCLVCQFPQSEPHHVNPDGHGGKGIKTDDMNCICLCTLHHRILHDTGKHTFAEKYGFTGNSSYENVIKKLNKIWEGIDAKSPRKAD